MGQKERLETLKILNVDTIGWCVLTISWQLNYKFYVKNRLDELR